MVKRKQHENQNERWMRINNLKLCKCGKRIPAKQKTCSFCLRWAKLDRGHQQYMRTHISISPYNKCLVMVEQKRLITKRQEQIFRLCHHDFEGLTQAEAAKRLGVVQSVIAKSLERVKKVFPQYFPIFTKFEMKCYHYYMVDGWSVADIVEYLEKTENAVYKALQRIRSKGAYFAGPTGRVLSYDESMDAEVKQKF